MKYWRFISVVWVALAFVLIESAPPAFAVKAPPRYRPVDVGPRLRAMNLSEVTLQLEGPAGEMALSYAEVGERAFYKEGETVLGLGYDDTIEALLFEVFTVRAIGEHIEVWVANELDFPTQDDRRNPVVVSNEQIDYLVEEFDNNIFPTMQSYFGAADIHDGSNARLGSAGFYVPKGGNDRVIAMISNIRDENYYYPDHPIYIAGFYWGSMFEYYLDRNVIAIDAYDWAHRVGPNDSSWRVSGESENWREFLYESVFAHEYQHLLHDDYDPNEEDWVNEGLSDLSEFLVGYGHPESHLRAAADYPENSLVAWGDQSWSEILSDYGHAYLFQLYLLEQFGQPFIQEEFLNPYNGISGVESTLQSLQIGERNFARIYHDFAVARLIDSGRPGRGRYAFENLDFNLNLGSPDAPNLEAFHTPGAPPWGTDYIWVDGDLGKWRRLIFDGADETVLPTAWSSDGNVLWSETGDLIDHWAIFEATGGGLLTFDTFYDIEGFYDFGFVQVSTDGGTTWTSLENAYTTPGHSPNTHPKVVNNLPGFTGYSGGWINMSFNLSAYPGDILIAFRYVTDWDITRDGWFVDNVYVDGTLITEGSTIEPLKDITELVPVENDFTVTFVGKKQRRRGYTYSVVRMRVNDRTEEGRLWLERRLRGSDTIVMLVTFDAPEGIGWYADYEYHDSTVGLRKPQKPIR